MRVLVLLFGLVASSAQAADSVAITRDPGYPSPGSNAVASRLVIAREVDMPPERAKATDDFLVAVRKVLAEGPVPPICCTRGIDMPFVEIDISLDGKTYELTMTSAGAGLEMSIQPTSEERRVEAVMERVLKLSEEWKAQSSH